MNTKSKQNPITKAFNFLKEASWQKLLIILSFVAVIVLVLCITGTTLKQLIGMNGDVKEINQKIERIEENQSKILEVLIEKKE